MSQYIIVIPTYNERDNIKILLNEIFSFLPDAHIMVVDDNSPDDTASAVKEYQKNHENVFLFSRSKKEGLGKAYISAFNNILKQNAYDIIAMMDADLSHQPKYLHDMLGLAKNNDLVIGSRYISHGGVTAKWGFQRKFLSKLANVYLRLLLRYPVQDWTTGYNMIRTDALKKIDFDFLSARGYAFLSSLKYYLIKSGAHYIESPIFFEERRGGESKMSWPIIREGIIAPWKIIFRGFLR